MNVFDEIFDYVKEHYKDNEKIKVHITQVDTKDNYNTLCGVSINDGKYKAFELVDVNNTMIENFKEEMDTWIRQNTLYLI